MLPRNVKKRKFLRIKGLDVSSLAQHYENKSGVYVWFEVFRRRSRYNFVGFRIVSEAPENCVA
jgi:hypothetical protein